jgi:hypothetical protein
MMPWSPKFIAPGDPRPDPLSSLQRPRTTSDSDPLAERLDVAFGVETPVRSRSLRTKEFPWLTLPITREQRR